MIIRQYRESDRREIGEIYVANWQKTYRGLLADALLDRMDPAEAAENGMHTHSLTGRASLWRKRKVRLPALRHTVRMRGMDMRCTWNPCISGKTDRDRASEKH